MLDRSEEFTMEGMEKFFKEMSIVVYEAMKNDVRIPDIIYDKMLLHYRTYKLLLDMVQEEDDDRNLKQWEIQDLSEMESLFDGMQRAIRSGIEMGLILPKGVHAVASQHYNRHYSEISHYLDWIRLRRMEGKDYVKDGKVHAKAVE